MPEKRKRGHGRAGRAGGPVERIWKLPVMGGVVSPKERYNEVLTPRPSESGLIWK